MLCLRSGPPGIIYSGIQLNALSCPDFCFIFFLYLDSNVLEDDTSISKDFFMQTKQLCALVHIRNKGEVGAVKHVSVLQ